MSWTGFIKDGYKGYAGPPKWWKPSGKRRSSIAEIVAAARRFEADGEFANALELRKLAAAKVRASSKWYRSLMRRK